MRRRVVGLVALVGIISARAEANCRDAISSCFCSGASVVGVVVTEQLDGGSALLRWESDAGGPFVMPSQEGETVGSRWLLFDEARRPIDASGNVTCEFLQTPVPATAVVTATANLETCESDLAAAGFANPPCYDNGPRCSVSPVLLSPLLLAWLLSTRASSRR
jgi:hypothetical protein